MERVEAFIMEMFISVFREKFRKIDFRLDFRIFSEFCQFSVSGCRKEIPVAPLVPRIRHGAAIGHSFDLPEPQGQPTHPA